MRQLEHSYWWSRGRSPSPGGGPLVKGPAQCGLNELAEVSTVVFPNCVQHLLQDLGAVLETEEHPRELGTLGDRSMMVFIAKNKTVILEA